MPLLPVCCRCDRRANDAVMKRAAGEWDREISFIEKLSHLENKPLTKYEHINIMFVVDS